VPYTPYLYLLKNLSPFLTVRVSPSVPSLPALLHTVAAIAVLVRENHPSLHHEITHTVPALLLLP